MGSTNISLNRIEIAGRLTRDPELRYSSHGKPSTHFSIANTRKYRKKPTNELVEDTSFFDVVYWGPGGEAVARHGAKGDMVIVSGRLHQDRWDVDGQSRSKVVIIATHTDLVNPKAWDKPGAEPVEDSWE